MLGRVICLLTVLLSTLVLPGFLYAQTEYGTPILPCTLEELQFLRAQGVTTFENVENLVNTYELNVETMNEIQVLWWNEIIISLPRCAEAISFEIDMSHFLNILLVSQVIIDANLADIFEQAMEETELSISGMLDQSIVLVGTGVGTASTIAECDLYESIITLDIIVDASDQFDLTMGKLESGQIDEFFQDLYTLRRSWWEESVPNMPDCAFAKEASLLAGQVYDETFITAIMVFDPQFDEELAGIHLAQAELANNELSEIVDLLLDSLDQANT